MERNDSAGLRGHRHPVLIATFELTTPLFGGAADPSASAPEIRVPSFKGVLRWWWRALAWSRFDGNLREIQVTEDRVFGSATTGRSRVLLRIRVRPDPKRMRTTNKGAKLVYEDGGVVGPGVRYLGYGLLGAYGKDEGRVTRPCIREGSIVDVDLRLRGLSGEDVGHLSDALIAMGSMGGMGARSRRGFGSLTLTCLEVPEEFNDHQWWKRPVDVPDLEKVVVSLRQKASDGPDTRPPYSAFTSAMDFAVYGPQTRENPALRVLNDVGENMMRYRSWGRNGQVLGRGSEQNFGDDYDLMASAAAHTQVNRHPRRVVFGLPHNYYFSSSEKKADVGPADPTLDRRASPLLIHVHSFGEGRHAAVLTVIPAVFLPPERDRLGVGSSTVDLAEDDLFEPLFEFLDRFRGSDGDDGEERETS